MRRPKNSVICRRSQHKPSSFVYISSRVEMQYLLYEPATLISNKADCPYCGLLLQPFCHISVLTLQNGCNNARYAYFIGYTEGLGSYVTGNVSYPLRTGEESILYIVPGGTELGTRVKTGSRAGRTHSQ